MTFAKLLSLASATGLGDGFDFLSEWFDANEDAAELPECSMTQALLLLLAPEYDEEDSDEGQRDAAVFALKSVVKDLDATIARLRSLR